MIGGTPMVFITGFPSSDFGFKMSLRLPCGDCAAGGWVCRKTP